MNKTVQHDFERLPIAESSLVFHPSKDRSVLVIAFFVIAVHLLLLFLTTIQSESKVIVKQQPRLVVKTIALAPRVQPASSSPPVVIEQKKIETESKPLPVALETPIHEPQDPPPVPVTKSQPKPPVSPKPAIQNKEPEPEKIKEKPKPKAIPAKTTATPSKEPALNKKSEPKKVVKKDVIKKEGGKKENIQEKTVKHPPIHKKESAKNEEKNEVEQPVLAAVDPQQVAAEAKRKELLENAQKSIAKMNQTRDKISSTRTVVDAGFDIPQVLETLEIETLSGDSTKPLTRQEINYRDELASRLKLQLRLPEYGEVKVKLTLERSGRVMNVLIVSAKSNANKKYIEKTLPTLTYPSFGNNFNGLSQNTFFITLSND